MSGCDETRCYRTKNGGKCQHPNSWLFFMQSKDLIEAYHAWLAETFKNMTPAQRKEKLCEYAKKNLAEDSEWADIICGDKKCYRTKKGKCQHPNAWLFFMQTKNLIKAYDTWLSDHFPNMTKAQKREKLCRYAANGLNENKEWLSDPASAQWADIAEEGGELTPLPSIEPTFVDETGPVWRWLENELANMQEEHGEVLEEAVMEAAFEGLGGQYDGPGFGMASVEGNRRVRDLVAAARKKLLQRERRNRDPTPEPVPEPDGPVFGPENMPRDISEPDNVSAELEQYADAPEINYEPEAVAEPDMYDRVLAKIEHFINMVNALDENPDVTDDFMLRISDTMEFVQKNTEYAMQPDFERFLEAKKRLPHLVQARNQWRIQAELHRMRDNVHSDSSSPVSTARDSASAALRANEDFINGNASFEEVIAAEEQAESDASAVENLREGVAVMSVNSSEQPSSASSIYVNGRLIQSSSEASRTLNAIQNQPLIREYQLALNRMEEAVTDLDEMLTAFQEGTYGEYGSRDFVFNEQRTELRIKAIAEMNDLLDTIDIVNIQDEYVKPTVQKLIAKASDIWNRSIDIENAIYDAIAEAKNALGRSDHGSDPNYDQPPGPVRYSDESFDSIDSEELAELDVDSGVQRRKASLGERIRTIREEIDDFLQRPKAPSTSIARELQAQLDEVRGDNPGYPEIDDMLNMVQLDMDKLRKRAGPDSDRYSNDSFEADGEQEEQKDEEKVEEADDEEEEETDDEEEENGDEEEKGGGGGWFGWLVGGGDQQEEQEETAGNGQGFGGIGGNWFGGNNEDAVDLDAGESESDGEPEEGEVVQRGVDVANSVPDRMGDFVEKFTKVIADDVLVRKLGTDRIVTMKPLPVAARNRPLWDEWYARSRDICKQASVTRIRRHENMGEYDVFNVTEDDFDTFYHNRSNCTLVYTHRPRSRNADDDGITAMFRTDGDDTLHVSTICMIPVLGKPITGEIARLAREAGFKRLTISPMSTHFETYVKNKLGFTMVSRRTVQRAPVYKLDL